MQRLLAISICLASLAACEREPATWTERAGQLRIGMTREQVIATLGKPEHVKTYAAPLEFTDVNTGQTTKVDVDEGLCYGAFEFTTDNPGFEELEGTYYRLECQMWQGKLVRTPITVNPSAGAD